MERSEEMSGENSSLSAKEIYDLGEKYSTKATIDSDFVPEFGVGARLFGTIASTGEEKSLIDFCCGIGVNPLGYSGDLKILPGNEWHNKASVLLKKKLCEIAPISGERKAFLCNSGAEAVETAIKMCQARRYREAKNGKNRKERNALKSKKEFVAFGGAFHGRTQGALSLNCSKKHHTEAFFEDRGDLSDDGRLKRRAIPVRHIPFPEAYNWESIENFENVTQKLDWHKVNAIFLEVVQGEGGIRVVAREGLRLITELCRKFDIYLVVDEVQTGMMRTGKMFACNHFSLRPDIICLSKALGGGQTPIGAVVCNTDFDFEKDGEHSNTFGGSPLPSALALQSITKLESLSQSSFLEQLSMLSSFAPEGLGFMRRIVFPTPETRNRVAELALEKGVLIIPAGEKAIRLMPPVNIRRDELEKGIAILKECIEAVK